MNNATNNYDRVNTLVEKYFDRLYATINFLVMFYGAILAFSYNKMDENVYLIGVFIYLLPVGTYVIGLLFLNNLLSITRATQFLLNIENKQSSLQWFHFCEKYSGHRTLAYGTATMFFMAAPIFDYFFALFSAKGSLLKNIFITIIVPAIMFVTYVVFFILIGTSIHKLRTETKELVAKQNQKDKTQH